MILSVLIHTVIYERKCKDILQNVLVITTQDREVKHKARGTFAHYFIYLQMASFSR